MHSIFILHDCLKQELHATYTTDIGASSADIGNRYWLLLFFMVQVRETRSSMLKRTGDSKEEHRRTVKSTTSHIHSIPQGVTTLHCDITSRPPHLHHVTVGVILL